MYEEEKLGARSWTFGLGFLAFLAFLASLRLKVEKNAEFFVSLLDFATCELVVFCLYWKLPISTYL